MAKKPRWEVPIDPPTPNAFEQVERLISSGQPTAAMAQLSALESRRASDPRYWALRAEALLAQGDPFEAIESAKKARDLNPRDVTRWRRIARIFGTTALQSEARQAFEAGLAKFPGDLELSVGLSELLRANNDVEGALDALSVALSANPRELRLLEAIIDLLLVHERHQEAVEALDALVGMRPGDAKALRLRGVTWRHLGNYRQAVLDLESSIKIGGEHREASLALARSQYGIDEGDPIGLLNSVIDKGDAGLEIFAAQAGMLSNDGDFEGALAALTHPNIAPKDRRLAELLAAASMPMIADSNEQIDQRRQAFREVLQRAIQDPFPIQNPVEEASITNFMLQNHNRNNCELQSLTFQALSACAPSLVYTSPKLDRPPVGNRKLRIGFASAYLRAHAVGRTLRRFIQHLDRERFEVVLIQMPAPYHKSWEETRSWADEVVLASTSLAGSRLAIEKANLDVLIYTDLPLDPLTNYLSISRLAPVQLTTWGHPGTAGRPSIDGWISCFDFDPIGNEDEYTEPLHRLTRIPMIVSPSETPAQIRTRDELGLPAGPIFGCVQSIQKIHPDFDPLIVEILDRVPGAHFLVVDERRLLNGHRLKSRIARRDPKAAERVLVKPRFQGEDYWSVLSHLSASLDPLHYTGANSTLDAWAMACPVVSWPGKRLVQRQTFALANQMGNLETIVHSARDYVDLAVNLAQDADLRLAVGARAAKSVSSLYDQTDVARELGDLVYRLAEDAIG